MRCISYCIAKALKIADIHAFFKPLTNFQTKLFRNVLHIAVSDHLPLNHSGDIFCFPQGCIIFWGLRRAQELEFLALIEKFSDSLLEKTEMDSFSFHMDTETKLYIHHRFNIDIIALSSTSVPLKLAISYGLAQSIKLASYEESLQKTIQANLNISEQLSARGGISLSRRAILKRMGEIFVERSYINLSSEYLEMPEYFWQYPNLETYYLLVEKYLDMPRRVSALNRKLDVLHEMFDMLNNQLQHSHSSILEMIVIGLIMVEIAISLGHGLLGL